MDDGESNNYYNIRILEEVKDARMQVYTISQRHIEYGHGHGSGN